MWGDRRLMAASCRRAWLGGAVLGIAALVAGCGSNGPQAPTRAAATVQPQPATVAAAASPAATTAAPAGTATAAASAITVRPATASATPAPTATAQAAARAAFPAQIVEPKDSRGQSDPTTWTFAPRPITVTAGATVTWTNTGISTHTVTADDGTSFDSGAIQRGDAWSFTFAKAGTFPYHCTFHSWMKGTVLVGG
ncbi:MAG TPA: plastocyanin/azurin family copper-binding protein [Dehalococcoidia bacterium]|nr:plastocyanin/azurin family copper-binding protein [Dehalococcoidia bacterium]